MEWLGGAPHHGTGLGTPHMLLGWRQVIAMCGLWCDPASCDAPAVDDPVHFALHHGDPSPGEDFIRRESEGLSVADKIRLEGDLGYHNPSDLC